MQLCQRKHSDAAQHHIICSGVGLMSHAGRINLPIPALVYRTLQWSNNAVAVAHVCCRRCCALLLPGTSCRACSKPSGRIPSSGRMRLAGPAPAEPTSTAGASARPSSEACACSAQAVCCKLALMQVHQLPSSARAVPWGHLWQL
jgi:hypothetical protein